MTDYEYDPDLPYVVTIAGVIQARFRSYSRAGEHAADLNHFRARVIDTTPKPRVPEDALYIAYQDPHGRLLYARRDGGGRWIDHDHDQVGRLESLPGVTPETTFTVLDPREES